VKALIAGGGCSKDADPAGLAGFYLLGAVPEPFTTYAAIRALPAGCHMSVDRLGVRTITPYYSLGETYRGIEAQKPAPGEAAEAVGAALRDSVRHHLVADVPIGVFLSSGIDSGAIVGLVRDAGQSEIVTVTLGFAEFAGSPDDETPLAARVAAQYETRHTARMITEREFEDDLPAILAAMDQPSIDGFNTWFVSKAARELGLKVALSGLGGDELFGGYPSFEQVPRIATALRWPGRVPILPAALRRLLAAAPLTRFDLSPKLAGLVEYGGTLEGAYLLRRALFMPWELPRILGRDFAVEGLRRLQPLRYLATAGGTRTRSSFARIAMLETAVYMRNQLLRDADWTSMAHGLEVRVPLVDHRLLEGCGAHILAVAAKGGRPKALLAQAPTKPLPAEVVYRTKTGFSTPIAHWVRKAVARRSGTSAQAKRTAPRELAQLVLAG
jgi:asparagine synthase (glutamine-hydrolysing)